MYSLPLPPGLRKQKWKVKIRNLEGPEEPHITVFGPGGIEIRIGLRDGKAMPGSPDLNLIPAELWREVNRSWELLRKEWDKMYGHFNPVKGEHDE